MVDLSVAVLARDNEDEIVDCLNSLAWADERIVILDTRSADRTAELAERLGRARGGASLSRISPSNASSAYRCRAAPGCSTSIRTSGAARPWATRFAG